ncbi:MAG TPA: hypothetical protein PKC46_05720 [Sphingorhabdus sp.]|nr:hypothetical protein [Sphingorhabdus sp.]
MPIFRTVKQLDEAVKLLIEEGIEPIIVDGDLVALKVGKVRIASSKVTTLQLSLEEDSYVVD